MDTNSTGVLQAPRQHVKRRRSPWQIAALTLFAFASLGSMLVVDAAINAEEASAASPPLCPVYDGVCVQLMGDGYDVINTFSRKGFWPWESKKCYETRRYEFFVRVLVYRDGAYERPLTQWYKSSSWVAQHTVRVSC